MSEKWIGAEDNTSGSYYERGLPELMIRTGGYHNAKKLYCFTNYVGQKYYLSDAEVIANIETFLQKEETNELQQYLYELVIQKFGIANFLSGVEEMLKEEGAKQFEKGRKNKLNEIKKVLEIKW